MGSGLGGGGGGADAHLDAFFTGAGDGRAKVFGGGPTVGSRAIDQADGGFFAAEQEPIDQFDALHEGMVGIGDFVFPQAEAAAAVDAVRFQPGQDGGEDVVAVGGGDGVAVFDATVPAGDDASCFVGLDDAGADEAGDGVVNDAIGIDGSERTGAGFAQEGVKAAIVGGHVGGVVAEVGDAIEGAVIFGEVHPAAGTGTGSFDAQADEVTGSMAEAGGGVADGVGDAADEHLCAESIQGHGGEEVVVADALAGGQFGFARFDMNADDGAAQGDESFKEGKESAVELAGTADEGVAELVVGTPAEVIQAKDDIAQCAVDIDDGDTFADPAGAEHGGRMRPDFGVVGSHEVACDAVAEGSVDELIEVGGGRGVGITAELCADESGEAFVGGLRWEVADVVLEGVGDPGVTGADPAFALIEGELVAHELLEEAVVVVVVAEDDMATEVPGEAGVVAFAARQAADMPGGFEQVESAVAEFGEAERGAQAGGAGSDNDDHRLVAEAMRGHCGHGWTIGALRRGYSKARSVAR